MYDLELALNILKMYLRTRNAVVRQGIQKLRAQTGNRHGLYCSLWPWSWPNDLAIQNFCMPRSFGKLQGHNEQ